jgi:hypothetical protein
MKGVAVFDVPRTAVGGQQISPVANIEADAPTISFEESFADTTAAGLRGFHPGRLATEHSVLSGQVEPLEVEERLLRRDRKHAL